MLCGLVAEKSLYNAMVVCFVGRPVAVAAGGIIVGGGPV